MSEFEARFHKKLLDIGLSKRQQGRVMGAFREMLHPEMYFVSEYVHRVEDPVTHEVTVTIHRESLANWPAWAIAGTGMIR